MQASLFRSIAVSALLIISSGSIARAQEYVPPIKPAPTGKSPGVKVKLLSTNGQTKTYAVIFSKGDEVVSGLTEFAQKYKVKSAHYTGIGDAMSAKVGWYDYGRKMFKVIPISKPSEVTSLIGDIAVFNGKPVAHTHINVATEDGITHGGHLLELIIGPTLEVIVTVEPTPMYKRLNQEFNAGIIDPALEK
ncbi:PPC domain-containing DNA-binding protein [Spirosoma validum]|uniref:DNA-binding protein n=1 Tax=Spirosoma validum TaxID=2771355 RepID=A0A927B6N9_9BACT|nr:PPC domain-containing DNA-binding protein [Spirosoma validum]MBD2756709.1 DNA-binding protein [Spirosoma validum]